MCRIGIYERRQKRILNRAQLILHPKIAIHVRSSYLRLSIPSDGRDSVLRRYFPRTIVLRVSYIVLPDEHTTWPVQLCMTVHATISRKAKCHIVTHYRDS